MNIQKIVTIICAFILLNGCKTLENKWIVDYQDPWHKKVEKAGFIEKSVQIEDVELKYAEGPNNGPALVMLHAQMMDWFDYSRVLPELSESYHIFVVDYNGHGKTTAPVETMNANSIGNTLAIFIENVVKEPAFITGNSSGGLLTVWLAANKPELVRAIVLEDPPLFSSEYPRVKQTIAYRSFTTCHNYIDEKSTDDFLIYWIKSNSAFIEKNAGKNAAPRLISAVEIYRNEHPGEPVELRFLPDMMRMIMRGMSMFDPAFGNSFYTGEWNDGFAHAEALAKIECPVLLIHSDYEILPDGTLNGAMDQNDADKVMSLLKNGEYKKIESMHVVHLDKPEEFITIVNEFFLGEKE